MSSVLNAIEGYCRQLRLPTIRQTVGDALSLATQENWSPEEMLRYLLEEEVNQREARRIERYQRESHLPPDKTLARFDQSRLPLRLQRRIAPLVSGEMLGSGDNLLIFGRPGTGKTHLAAALGHEWVQHGRRVFFTPTFRLVEGLLRAKQNHELEHQLKRLDRFEAVILDDFGYVQQSRQEMEVLFTFLAERYERRSVVITSNLVFSQWDQIFKDPLTTAAAIDRVVHHSRILEFGADITSLRAEEAARRQQAEATAGETA